ncbi:hypothetical protein AAFF_G00109230 [Aldrovandia affinis]|uniref:Uncharacterized protein n=1 Tax=Aldrovandia affinis TaxID=143900 RepID=A0AAD7RTP4_9TELE|nr:hypothetical protein AAFF_G00109230 [Aldrovandia affinis]
MEFHSRKGNQGHQFGALVGQHNSHLYWERPHTPDLQQHWSGGDWSHKLGWGAALGSRTCENLHIRYRGTDGLLINHHTFPQDGGPRSQGTLEYCGREGGGKAEMGREKLWRAHESERSLQNEKGWESHGSNCPIRRDCRSQREKVYSGLEVELWKDPHYHSLPQKGCLEARLWGLQERGRIPQWVERGDSTGQQGALCPSGASHHPRGFRQKEEKQHANSYSMPLRQSLMRSYREERNSQRVMFGQPPSYVSPPPYSDPCRTKLVMQHQKCALSRV